MNPRFLVRSNDYHIWELDPYNNCYRSYSTRQVTYSDGTRPNARHNYTFENLTENYGYYPIEESELPRIEALGEKYHKILNKYYHSDGHGGIDGDEKLTEEEKRFIGL